MSEPLPISDNNPQAIGPTVLICPLDWGLGHATRCIPVAEAFLKAGCRVIICASGAPLSLLREALGNRAAYREFPGAKVTYSGSGKMFASMLMLFPRMLWSVVSEHHRIRQLIRETQAKVVVSDNRYGLFSRKAETVLITHQLFLEMPSGLKAISPLADAFVRFLVRRFDQCWIPDIPGVNSLAGRLASKRPFPASRHIGLLSRFPARQKTTIDLQDIPPRFILIVLSGPEPQRSILENILIGQLPDTAWPAVIVRGKPMIAGKELLAGHTVFGHLESGALWELICKSELVVCRPGYTSLMDLAMAGRKALLIPTPGQTEQEYLGNRMQQHGWALTVEQAALDLRIHLPQAFAFSGIPRIDPKREYLESAIRLLISPGTPPSGSVAES